jgi:hypothetical protein
MSTRILGPTGPRRRRRIFLYLPLTLAALAAVAFAISGSAVADTANCANTATLDGSAFEIDADDANLKVDTAGCIDWLAGGTNSAFRTGVLAKNDAPTGSGDDSFGQGTAEDNPNPTIVTGSIPPNKSDLKAFGIYTEPAFLELFWSRVQNPSGTTNMDFELNKLACDGTATNCANNGSSKAPVYVTPKRSAGDKLITYDLSQGGTHPAISIRTWIAAAGKVAAHWSDADVISDGNSPDALGSINTTLIPSTETGGATGGLTASLGSQDPFTFGEAAISFEALFGTGACGTFGSAYLKSRSSDSFTSEVKDFVAPEKVRISNCPSGLTTTATATATVGGPISDTAHLTVGAGAGGTITFHLFNAAGCAAASEVNTGLSPVSVDGPGDYPSGDYTTTAVGTYYWTAVYTGDQTNDGSSTACGDAGETSIVSLAPSTISTAQRWFPQDTATIDHSGGTVTFTLFKNDNTCADATKIVFGPTSAIAVSGSAPFTASTSNMTFSVSSVTSGDKYYWKAAYSGDTTHKAVTSSCQESTTFSALSNGDPVTSP